MMIICCDIVEPSTGELYGRDPRSTAKRAEAFVKSSGVGDTVYVGPEAEFFVFDDVRFYDGYDGNGFKIDDIELPTNVQHVNTTAATTATVRAPRAATSRSPRSTAASTSAARWSRPCSKWACPATSTTTKSPRPSTNLA
jgi:glutamine synthetase